MLVTGKMESNGAFQLLPSCSWYECG